MLTEKCFTAFWNSPAAKASFPSFFARSAPNRSCSSSSSSPSNTAASALVAKVGEAEAAGAGDCNGPAAKLPLGSGMDEDERDACTPLGPAVVGATSGVVARSCSCVRTGWAFAAGAATGGGSPPAGAAARAGEAGRTIRSRSISCLTSTSSSPFSVTASQLTPPRRSASFMAPTFHAFSSSPSASRADANAALPTPAASSRAM
mmetsp:Transcript_5079/g.11606  ORF Transcript_5079/g.11606 Transcript_5079/m.11606 type:complete len:204 (-) Transcript_5079:91-702(-)